MVLLTLHNTVFPSTCVVAHGTGPLTHLTSALLHRQEQTPLPHTPEGKQNTFLAKHYSSETWLNLQ